MRSYIIGHETHLHYLTDKNLSLLRKKTEITSKQEEFLKIARVLSDPTRIKIYNLLKQVKEISVSDLATSLQLSQSATSHALRDLKTQGLVEYHRCGKLICYSLRAKLLWKNLMQ